MSPPGSFENDQNSTDHLGLANSLLPPNAKFVMPMNPWTPFLYSQWPSDMQNSYPAVQNISDSAQLSSPYREAAPPRPSPELEPGEIRSPGAGKFQLDEGHKSNLNAVCKNGTHLPSSKPSTGITPRKPQVADAKPKFHQDSPFLAQLKKKAKDSIKVKLTSVSKPPNDVVLSLPVADPAKQAKRPPGTGEEIVDGREERTFHPGELGIFPADQVTVNQQKESSDKQDLSRTTELNTSTEADPSIASTEAPNAVNESDYALIHDIDELLAEGQKAAQGQPAVTQSRRTSTRHNTPSSRTVLESSPAPITSQANSEDKFNRQITGPSAKPTCFIDRSENSKLKVVGKIAQEYSGDVETADVEDWLALTGFHDVEYRNNRLSRRRRLRAIEEERERLISEEEQEQWRPKTGLKRAPDNSGTADQEGQPPSKIVSLHNLLLMDIDNNQPKQSLMYSYSGSTELKRNNQPKTQENHTNDATDHQKTVQRSISIGHLGAITTSIKVLTVGETLIYSTRSFLCLVGALILTLDVTPNIDATAIYPETETTKMLGGLRQDDTERRELRVKMENRLGAATGGQPEIDASAAPPVPSRTSLFDPHSPALSRQTMCARHLTSDSEILSSHSPIDVSAAPNIHHFYARPIVKYTYLSTHDPTTPAEERTVVQNSDATDTYTTALHTSNAVFRQNISKSNPLLLSKLASGQSPQILWIGCSDSRCPETTILGLQPGDVFVHRNIANILTATDLNSLSVIQYAVQYLKVKHVVVCGHTSCGGVAAALGNRKLGLIDTWLMPLRALRKENLSLLDGLPEKERGLKLVELNVRSGIDVLMENPVVIDAVSERGLKVHGLIYDVGCGTLKELDIEEDEEVVKGRTTVFKTE